ncbi:MAG: NERD domain-containing protein [Eubacteriales bacterium]|nr:NERD domain-containing protein [Eubacteriales bacterium]
MSFLHKPRVILYKDADSFDSQINELKELEQKATGKLKNDISKQIALLSKGSSGENDIMFQLNYADTDMFVLRDLYLESGDLSAQIDYYIITPKLNFIVECKNMNGNITVNSKGDFIRTLSNGHKEGIPSPITQNERHMLVVKNCKLDNANAIGRLSINKYFNDFYIPLVVLANSKTILNDRYAPKNIRNKIIRSDQLVSVINKYNSSSKEQKRTFNEMERSAQKMLDMCRKNPVDYVEIFRKRLEEQEKVQNDNVNCSAEKENNAPVDYGICPRCNAKLVKRNGKNGEFIGCSRFPKCFYTKPIK